MVGRAVVLLCLLACALLGGAERTLHADHLRPATLPWVVVDVANAGAFLAYEFRRRLCVLTAVSS